MVPGRSESEVNRSLIADLINEVPDFPKPGVMFSDITPLLASPRGFEAAVVELVRSAIKPVDVVVGMEARGFMFAAPVALALGAGFVPVRKPGKLPGEVLSQTFTLEYGNETLCVRRDAIAPGARVLVVDDVLATGGTVGATATLVKQLDAEVVGVGVLLELTALGGRAQLAAQGLDVVHSVVSRG